MVTPGTHVVKPKWQIMRTCGWIPERHSTYVNIHTPIRKIATHVGSCEPNINDAFDTNFGLRWFPYVSMGGGGGGGGGVIKTHHSCLPNVYWSVKLERSVARKCDRICCCNYHWNVIWCYIRKQSLCGGHWAILIFQTATPVCFIVL